MSDNFSEENDNSIKVPTAPAYEALNTEYYKPFGRIYDLIVELEKSDKTYKYKRCGNYIVYMEDVDGTITNESRRDKISKYYPENYELFSRYRANKLEVIRIEHISDASENKKVISNTFYKKRILIIKLEKLLK